MVERALKQAWADRAALVRKLAMRVKLASGERVTMPLGLATFVMREPQ